MSYTIMLSPKSSLFWLVWVLCLFWSAGHSNMNKSCIDTNKKSLLKLKDGFIDELGVLSSWKSEVDCCQWSGVACSNLTGHVIELTLHELGGNIDPSLCDLHNLTHLNLDDNNFEGSKIPECIDSLSQLRGLSMSHSSISGAVPRGLQNLSNLQTLNLRDNDGLVGNDLEWISHLSSLSHLDLAGVNLSQAVDWQSSISKAPNLYWLNLDECALTSHHVNAASFVHINSSTCLEVLFLSGNYLDSSILPWLSNISKVLTDLNLPYNNLDHIFPNALQINSLQFLDLSSNSLQLISPQGFSNMNSLQDLCLHGNSLRHIPLDAFINTTYLEFIDLQYNKLESSMLKSFSNLCQLQTLHLSNNNLSRLSEWIPQLRCALNSIQELDLSDNPLGNGPFPDFSRFSKLTMLNLVNSNLHVSLNEKHLSTLSNLRVLTISQNPVSFNVSSNWVPPFQLDQFLATSSNFGPQFPRWLKYQAYLKILDISNASISDLIPKSFWLNSFRYLNLSRNRLYGELPKSFLGFEGYTWDLSFNNLSGPLPYFPPKATMLLLSNNMFSGTISSICAMFNSMLYYLDISSNVLSGRLPDCWGQLPNLEFLRLENNHFYGEIPNSLGTLNNLGSIHLNNNNLSGNFPSLINSSYLRFIDFGKNNLHGKLPSWIGQYMHSLIGLCLRENKLQGSIPTNLCNLSKLQILDLSKNNMTGDIPHCFGHLSAMSNMTSTSQAIFDYVLFYDGSPKFYERATLSWKGHDAVYSKILALMKTIDLSCNRLTGEIPSGITKLVALASLNLSFNNFKGSIPFNMGRMQRLESLDLSNNSLSGEIPISFSSLSFLSVLRLSFNNLSGKIPITTQLETFNASSYMGNKGLCGPPLTERCPEDGSSYLNPNPSYKMDADGGDNLISFGFYVSLAFGFIIGFWGVCGTLILKHSWRHSFFQFFENMNDWIYVHLAILKAKIKRRFHDQH